MISISITSLKMTSRGSLLTYCLYKHVIFPSEVIKPCTQQTQLDMESVAEISPSSNVYAWLALGLGIVIFIYWQGLRRYNSILADCPLPGPKPWPWLGNLPDVFKYGGMHKMFLTYFYKYGRVHKMCFGRTPVIVVSDPEIVKQIMVKEFWKFPNRPPFIKPNPPLSSGLFVSRNETWKRIRNTLTPTFTAAKLKQIVPIIDEASTTLSGKMKTFSETGKQTLLELGVKFLKTLRRCIGGEYYNLVLSTGLIM